MGATNVFQQLWVTMDQSYWKLVVSFARHGPIAEQFRKVATTNALDN